MKKAEDSFYLVSLEEEKILMGKTVLDDIFTEDSRYILLKDLFFADSDEFNEESNLDVPLEDSLFLLSIFEFINIIMYIHKSDYIIDTVNKTSNLVTIKNRLNYLVDQKDCFCFSYAVNPLKRSISKMFSFGLETIDISYSHAFNYKVKVPCYSIRIKSDNFNNFITSVIMLYEWFIEIIYNKSYE